MHNPPVLVVTPDMRDSTLSVIRSLALAELLRGWVTTVAVHEDTPILKWLPKSVRAELLKRARSRRVPHDLGAPAQAIWWREALRLAATRSGLSDSACHRVWHWAELGFDADVAAKWPGRVPCIYGCEHASLETFRRQRAAGGLNLQWQVIADQRTSEAILREEQRRFPAARTAYSELSFEDAPATASRKQVELELADLVVCNSEFARRSFLAAGLPPEKVVAVPTGCPAVVTTADRRLRNAKPHVFVFAGTLSLRKGVQYLLEAWRRAKPAAPAELWLVGKQELPDSFFRNLPSNVQVRPAIPRAELHAIFERAGVLVFPTLCEGRARVVLEAAAAGLALLTTPSSGCEDIVEDGVNGWLMEARAVESLAEKITWCLDHPDAVRGMWSASLEKAARRDESRFAREHSELVSRFLSSRGIH